VGGTGTTNPGTFDVNNMQCIGISNWLDFLSSTEVIDTDLLGDVRVSITLADTNVLVIDNYSTDYKTINYSLNKLYFTVNNINLSPEWYQAQAMFLEKGGILQRKCSLWWAFRAFQGSVVPEPNSLLHRSPVRPRPYQECTRNPFYPVEIPLKQSTSLWHLSPWIC
jgi:hypothetical protein